MPALSSFDMSPTMDDISMLSTNLEYPPTNTQPPNNFEDCQFAFDNSCRHRKLQELPECMGVSNDAMGNTSPMHVVQSKNIEGSTRKVGGTGTENLRK